MVFKSIIGATCACLAVISFNATASLIDNGTITTDDRTGLEWLDLTDTVGMSYDQVTAQMIDGGSLAGWSYATSSQIASFFDSAGGNGIYTGWSTANNGVVDRIAALWGFTNPTPGTDHARFLQAKVNTEGRHVYGWLSDTIATSESTLSDYMILEYGDWPDDQYQAFQASALVRTSVVPLPSAVWLFGSGLLGLIGVARREVRV